MEVHKQVWIKLLKSMQFLDANEAPLFLTLDTDACGNPNTKELPVSIFETEVFLQFNLLGSSGERATNTSVRNRSLYCRNLGGRTYFC